MLKRVGERKEGEQERTHGPAKAMMGTRRLQFIGRPIVRMAMGFEPP
jgi:hypothetical protein